MADNNLAGMVGNVQRVLDDKLQALQQVIGNELDAIKHAAASADGGQAAVSGGDNTDTLVGHLRNITKGYSQVDLLQALVTAASAYLPRVLLLIRKGNNLHGWAGSGFEEAFMQGGLKRVKWTIDGFAELNQVVNQKQPLITNFNELSDISNEIENFDGFHPFKSSFFPLVVKGKVAAVLYADSGDSPQLTNVELAEILCYYTGVELTLVTTKLKTQPAEGTQPVKASPAPQSAAAASATPQPAAPKPKPEPVPEPTPTPQPAAQAAAKPAASAAGGDDPAVKKAKRVARVLVSDLKLYNEDAVEKGCANGDLYSRLKDDLDRSYKHYQERIADLTLDNDTNYFKEELIRQLGGGNPNALGPLPF